MLLGRALPFALAFLVCPAVGAGQATAWLREAEALLSREPSRAVILASQAVAFEPESLQAHAILGRAAAQAGQPELAVVHLERALNLGGEDLRLRLYLASALWEMTRYEEAEASFRRACQFAGNGPRGLVAWHQLGRLLLWLGRATEAISVLERAANLGPHAPDVALDLARALDLAGDPRTLGAFVRAVALAPESPRAHWGLAQQLLAAGRLAEGAAELELFRDLYRREQETVRNEGLERAALDQAWNLLLEGDPGAGEAFTRLSDGAEAIEGLARAESSRGRHAQAVTVLERGVRRFPENEILARLLERERLALVGQDPP
jgi:Flp pilus assembly protein TadD